MKDNFNSLIELIEYFDSEQKCAEYIAEKRWGTAPVCPHCNSEQVYRFSDKIRYKCSGCSKQFTVRIGTIFENSKVSLKKWIVAMYLHSSDKKGISSYQLSRQIKVTQRTAWFMLHRLRYAMGFDNDPNEQVEGIVELDETFVGGKNKNRHKDKKVKNSQGRSFKDKTPILGIMQRNGKVKTIVIPSTGGEYIQPLVQQIVKDHSVLMTDEWQAYNGLERDYVRFQVNHGAGYYGDSLVHTNNIEGFWNWIKRSIMGVYHVVSAKHLQQYAHEATFRFNTRGMNDFYRLNYALSSTSGALSYKQLISK